MEKIKDLAFILLCTVFIVSLILNAGHYADRKKHCRPDTLRVTVTDTIPFYKPVPKDSTVIRYVTEKLHADITEHPESVTGVTENSQTLTDSVRNTGERAAKSIDVIVPITQTVYEDSLYTAYVSGYKACLDSLMLRTPREEITIKTGDRSRRKRWGIGVQAGYGWALKGTPRLEPYIGLGITYNLYSF